MISAITHQFRRGKVNNDGSSLYTSFRCVSGIWNTSDNDYLRSIVTDYILKNKALYHERFGIGWCDNDDEIEALGALFHKIVRLVSKTKTDQGEYVTHILNYGEHVESNEGCVFILYDGETQFYEPLYMINKQNMNEILTIFQIDDEEAVFELLAKFIREDLHDVAFVQLGSRNIADANELPIETEDETEQIVHMLVPDAGVNISINRRIPNHAGLSFSKMTDEHI